MSQIEAKYFNFKKQLTCANYFLLFLGCDFDFETYNKVENGAANVNSDNQLYFEYGDFKAINKIFSSSKDANNVMNSLLKTVQELLKRKMPINDDLLVLCFEYCKLTYLKANSKKSNILNNILGSKNATIMSDFITVLQNISKECLDAEYESEAKVRNYQWFKQYLSDSNIWMMETGTNEQNPAKDNTTLSDKAVKTKNNNETKEKEKKTDDDDEKESKQQQAKRVRYSLVYDYLEDTVDHALKQQKQFIHDNTLEEEKLGEEIWHELLNIEDYKSNKYKDIRQDCIDNGVKSDFTEAQLWEIAINIDNTNFDAFNIMTKSHLNKCLVTAQSLNFQFQNDVEKVFHKINDSVYFQTAMVKLEERSLVKANVDYAQRPFPSSAAIVDYVRCSVTFDTAPELVEAIKIFKEKVKNKQAGCIVEIVRVKNSFNRIKKWHKVDDYGYCGKL